MKCALNITVIAGSASKKSSKNFLLLKAMLFKRKEVVKSEEYNIKKMGMLLLKLKTGVSQNMYFRTVS